MATNQSLTPAILTSFQEDDFATLAPTEPHQDHHRSPEAVSVSIKIIISLTGTLGNSLVVLAILVFPKMRSITNWVILSLALTDLGVCIFCIPLAIYSDEHEEWRLGPVLCYLWTMIDYLLSVSSIWHLCTLSIDRYLALFRPVWYRTKRTTSFVLALITIPWGIGSLVSLSTLVGSKGHYHIFFGVASCFIYVSSAGFGLFLFVVSFGLPTAILVAVYIKMTLTIWSRRVRVDVAAHDHQGGLTTGGATGELLEMSKTVPSNEASTSTKGTIVQVQDNCAPTSTTENQSRIGGRKEPQTLDVTFLIPPGTKPDENRDIRTNAERKKVQRKSNVRQEVKAAVVIAIVVVTFLICWGPFFLTAVLRNICKVCVQIKVILPTLFWLGYSNSALNPIIYTIFNSRFRSAFKDVMLCKMIKLK